MINHIKNIIKMFTYIEELSSCEDASNFYLSVLSEMYVRGTGWQVLSMNLNIDRGITNFDDFKDILILGFSSLQELNINQNYTSNDCTDKENYSQFVSFIKELKLIRFKFVDNQSTFVKLITVNDLFEIMPANSEYRFKLGDVDDIQEVLHYKDNKCIKYSCNPYL